MLYMRLRGYPAQHSDNVAGNTGGVRQDILSQQPVAIITEHVLVGAGHEAPLWPLIRGELQFNMLNWDCTLWNSLAQYTLKSMPSPRSSAVRVFVLSLSWAVVQLDI